MIPYIIEISDKDFTIGFERVDVPPYLVNKENGAIDAESFAMTLKSAVLGLNSLCKQETPDIILIFPQTMSHAELMKYIYSCKKYDIIIRRTLSNTSAIALTKLVQTKEDMIVLIMVREKNWYSAGLYESGGGICESLGQGFFRNENEVLKWVKSFGIEASEHLVVVSTDSINSSLFEKEWKTTLNVEYVPKSSIVSGGAILSNMLNKSVEKYSDIVLLDSINDSFGVLIYGSEHILITNDTTIPCKSTEVFSASFTEQKKIVLCFTNKQKEIIGAISVVRATPFDINKPEIEVTFDIDANKDLAIEIKDLLSGKTKTYRAFEDLPPFNLSVNEIIKYLPSLYNENTDE